MWRSTEEYVRNCDSCQRRKENREYIAPLGEVDETFAFEVSSMDITVSYVTTPRKNKFLLTFVDHLTRYVEAFPLSDPIAETIACRYVTQIVKRHGTGSKLITDQGRGFISDFFQRNL
jgi:transposase InsO family protein